MGFKEVKLSIEFPTLKKNITIPRVHEDDTSSNGQLGIQVNSALDSLGENVSKFISDSKEREQKLEAELL